MLVIFFHLESRFRDLISFCITMNSDMSWDPKEYDFVPLHNYSCYQLNLMNQYRRWLEFLMAMSAVLESEHITTSFTSRDSIVTRACSISCSSAENVEVRGGSTRNVPYPGALYL